MTRAPSEAVLDGFGVVGDPVALTGGKGMSFRVGDFVLKPVYDTDEAEWVQALLSRTVEDGFRIPEPRAALDGSWVHAGWTAARFLHGLHPAAPAWGNIIDAGLRFADAAERVREGGSEILARLTHHWAVADRVAWGEAQVPLHSEAEGVLDAIKMLVGDTLTDEHLVHGDLSGNVYLDPSGDLVILDVSPYLRPRRWAAAIVIADAVLWYDAEPSLATSFASDATDRDLLARALIFRLVAHVLADRPHDGEQLQPYRSVLAVLT